MTKEKLAIKIRKFLDKYACRDAEDNSEYASPDASLMASTAHMLEMGLRITYIPWSEWGSGGYKPYTSKTGRKEHDRIMELIKNFVGKD